MAERATRKGDRFRWWNSDRSGFQFGFSPLTSPPNSYYREDGRPVNDKGHIVAPDEYDQPPPSTKPLGGADIGSGARSNSDSSATPTDLLIPVQYIPASGSISWNYNNVPIQITGSNSAVTVGNNSLSAAPNGTYIALLGVGSGVTINSGNGITFDFINVPSIRLDSGSIATLIYNATDSTWHVTSYTQNRGW